MVESAGRAEASITRLASATASGAHASSSSTSCVTASSSSPAGATRVARPIRSASSAPISLPVITSSFARPSPTTWGSREDPPTSGISPIRVSGMPTIASAASTRKSHASASSSAPPMHAPWIAQMTGLGISSARFHASRQWRRNVRSCSGAALSAPSDPRSMPDENSGPAPRTTTTRTAGSSAAARSAVPVASTSSSWNALRFSGRLRTRWRTGP